MGGNKQRKSSSSFFSIFNIFGCKSTKPKVVHHDAHDTGPKVWPSDEDKGQWGVAEPGIDMKAEAYIAQFQKRVSESARVQLDPAEPTA